jgi:hypothetical protein
VEDKHILDSGNSMFKGPAVREDSVGPGCGDSWGAWFMMSLERWEGPNHAGPYAYAEDLVSVFKVIGSCCCALVKGDGGRCSYLCF